MQRTYNYIKNNYLLLLSLVFILVIYLLVDVRMYRSKTVPIGDEPDFLLIAHSIAYDHDINLHNNEVNKDWSKFYSADTLAVRYGWENKQYSLFNFGFPLILAVPYRFGGYPGVMAFNSFLTVLLLFSIYHVTRRMLNLERLNPLGIWILALSTPFFTFSSQIYPDVIVGLIILWDLYIIIYYPENKYLNLFMGLSFVVMAFFHLKYFIPIGLLGGIYILRSNNWTKRIVMTIWIPIVLLMFLYGNYLIYGQFNYRAAYPKFSLATIGRIDFSRTFQTHLFDPQYGILFHAPILLLIPFGMYCLLRSEIKNKYWYLLSIPFLFIGYLSFFCSNPTFHIGWGAAGRQIYPMMSLVAIFLLMALHYGKGWAARILQTVLFIPGLLLTIFGVIYPAARYEFPHYLNKIVRIPYKWMPYYWEYWDPTSFANPEPPMHPDAYNMTLMFILATLVITVISIYLKYRADKKSPVPVLTDSQ